jgi:hypothetical protein
MSGLSRITMNGNNNFAGFKHRINDVLQGKCHIFIARGEFLNSDVPSTKTALAGLINGSSSPFLPLGDMDATGSNIAWTEKTIDVDFSTLGAGYDITGTFVSITVNKNMFQFVTDLGHSRYSFLFVPEGTDDVLFAVSGVTITTEGNLGVVEDGLSKITFKVSRKANKITDVIKFARYSNVTGAIIEDNTQQSEQ